MPDLRKLASTAAAIGVAALTFAIWLHFHDKAVRRIAALAAQDSALTVQTRQRDSLEAARRADSASFLARLRTREQALAAARVRGDSLSSILHAGLPDTLRPVLDSLNATHAAQLAIKDSTILDWRHRWISADSAAIANLALAHQWQRTAELWRSQVKSGRGFSPNISIGIGSDFKARLYVGYGFHF